MSNIHAPMPQPIQTYQSYDYPPPRGPSPYDGEGTPMFLSKPPNLVDSDSRLSTRTPSPTPSEIEFLQKKGISSIDFKNFKKYFSRKYLVNWIILTIGIAITVVSIALHDQIIRGLEPWGQKIKALPAGWLIPVALFIIASFPPLFGHEIIAVLCGVVWGLGVGFAITAVGTLLGELASFLTFRYACAGRIEKRMAKNLKFGVLAKVVREGGWVVILMARLSAIPPHFTTVVFAICRTNLIVFTLTAIVTLPRQFATVYLGVLAANSADGKKTKGQTVVTIVVIGVTTVMTIYSMRYLNTKIDAAKPAFVYERRKARAGSDVQDLQLEASREPSVDYTMPPPLHITSH